MNTKRIDLSDDKEEKEMIIIRRTHNGNLKFYKVINEKGDLVKLNK